MSDTNETHFEDGTEITSYLAAAYAEGFCEGEGASSKDQIKAWSFLIATGQCWTLQGCYGRTAKSLIDSGLINSNGVVNWEEYGE